jgi:glucose/arabinose dehydrogenase
MSDLKKLRAIRQVAVAVALTLLLAACSPVSEVRYPLTPATAPPRIQSDVASPSATGTRLKGEAEAHTVTVLSLTAQAEAPTAISPAPTRGATSLPRLSIPAEFQEIIGRARQDLAKHLQLAEGEINTVSVEAVEWPDASLGCPQPGMMYAQVVTPGSLIVLKAAGRRYEYHTSASHLLLCELQGPSPAVTELPTSLPPRAWPIPQQGIEVSVPAGFRLDIFAEGLMGPRFMALGPQGILYVAERGARRVIALPDRNSDGRADEVVVVADSLVAPSSLAFHEGALYVGETTQITRLVLDESLRAVERKVVISGLPTGRGHSTRTVIIGSDGQMFVSVGSSCNVCVEDDARRAAISVYPPQGGEGRLYAKGLRNAVGMAINPWTGSLWATNNGRDRMGDDVPPETVYVVRDGADYGWPRCHAGDIPDPEFGGPGACEGVEAPVVEMQAHSAPLGIAFHDGEQFPSEYRGSAYIAFHGSWDRTMPTGYKVVRVPVGDDQATGPVQDFATGWLQADGSARGRPVGVTVGADGGLYVSDDQAGLIYRIIYDGGQ